MRAQRGWIGMSFDIESWSCKVHGIAMEGCVCYADATAKAANRFFFVWKNKKIKSKMQYGLTLALMICMISGSHEERTPTPYSISHAPLIYAIQDPSPTAPSSSAPAWRPVSLAVASLQRHLAGSPTALLYRVPEAAGRVLGGE